MNIHTYVSMWAYAFNSLRHIPLSEITELNNNSTFNFLRYFNWSPQRLGHSIFPPAIYETSNYSRSSSTVVFIIIIMNQVGVKWYLIVFLNHIHFSCALSWASFHSAHLHISLREISIPTLLPFYFCFSFIFELYAFWHILDTRFL